MDYAKLLLFNVMVILNLHWTLECPHELGESKATYKSGEMADQSAPITLEQIKRRLKESGIFDADRESLGERERKELSKLFDAVGIMSTSRARQPASAQGAFASLRLVERAVKKQLKEGQISETLAGKFHWDKLSVRQKRDKPFYRLDEGARMRVFDLSS